MAKPMIQFDEFRSIFNIMDSVKPLDNEPYNKYFVRLHDDYGVSRSRTSLQTITKAKKASPNDEKAAYEMYKKLSKGRQRNRKEKEKLKQIEMDLTPAGEQEGKNNEELIDPEALRVRVSFELGETARKAIDALLALVGVRL